jgi:hypothetical protein
MQIDLMLWLGAMRAGCAGNYLGTEIPSPKKGAPAYACLAAAAGNIRRTGSARSGTTRTRT